MPTLTALTLSIGGFAFVIVYLGTTVMAGIVALWALFIA
jgi:SNF family Na+-dependent transporter